MATPLFSTLSKICGGVFLRHLSAAIILYFIIVSSWTLQKQFWMFMSLILAKLAETKESKHGQKEWYKEIASATKRFNAVALSEKFNGEWTETKS